MKALIDLFTWIFYAITVYFPVAYASLFEFTPISMKNRKRIFGLLPRPETLVFLVFFLPSFITIAKIYMVTLIQGGVWTVGMILFYAFACVGLLFFSLDGEEHPAKYSEKAHFTTLIAYSAAILVAWWFFAPLLPELTPLAPEVTVTDILAALAATWMIYTFLLFLLSHIH